MSLCKTARSIRRKVENFLQDDDNAGRNAAITGGIASAAYALPKSIHEQFVDEIERRQAPLTMDDVRKKIMPGDIILSRVSDTGGLKLRTDQALPFLKGTDLGRRELPVTANNIIKMVLGSPYTHTSVKMQNADDILNVMMGNEGAKIEDLTKAMANEEFKIYRPYGNMGDTHDRVMARLGGLVGKPYRETKDVIMTGLRTFLDPFGTKTSPLNLCKGQTCTTAVGNAMPHIFPTEETVVDTLRSSPKIEFIGRYNPGGILPNAYENFATRIGSPLLKSLKYALPTAGAVYAYNKLRNHYDS